MTFDVVLTCNDATRGALIRAFPDTDFYRPSDAVIRTEQARAHRGESDPGAC